MAVRSFDVVVRVDIDGENLTPLDAVEWVRGGLDLVVGNVEEDNDQELVGAEAYALTDLDLFKGMLCRAGISCKVVKGGLFIPQEDLRFGFDEDGALVDIARKI